MDSANFDVIIVGAGFSGIYMLERCRALGLSARLIESGGDVGGTWYWNRYPGARCDVESMTYSYSFLDSLQKEWRWHERYATQPDILRYINHVVDRLDLRRDMQLRTRVTGAAFDEGTGRWTVETDRDERLTASCCVMATGCLSRPNLPDFPGLDRFEGEWIHTGNWPAEGAALAGKRVGIVGTGSTAIQMIPLVAEQAKQLVVFQRTANFSIPAWNGPIAEEARKRWEDDPEALRERARWSRVGDIFEISDTSALAVSPEERQRIFEKRWNQGAFNFLASFGDLLTSKRANDYAVAFVHDKIRERVHDPAVAELLCPRDHPLGTKRLCVDTDYYETFNRENVTLVDVREGPIEEITPTGLKAGGTDYPLDVILFATGFDAMTGALLAIDIRGRGGVTLRERWAHGPRSYMGLAVAGFPNFFTVTGPGSPSVLSNMMISIEQHIEWIADCLSHMSERGIALIEATGEAEDAWMTHANELAGQMLYFESNTWYVGANIPGKPRVCLPYVGGVGHYRKLCDEVAAKGYDGFVQTPARAAA